MTTLANKLVAPRRSVRGLAGVPQPKRCDRGHWLRALPRRLATSLLALALGGCHDCGLVSCDDGDPCTADKCTAEGCTHTFITGPCNDDSVCTTADYCGNEGCTGTPLDCDDHIACTLDSCDEIMGCRHLAGDSARCDDANPCTDDVCDVVTGCQHPANAAPCDDGNACTVGDTCGAGICLTGNSPLWCNDGNLCTDDVCRSTSGCQHIVNTAPCDDDNPCTLGDGCGGGTCLAGELGVFCDDNDPCTTDACNPGTGHCGHVTNMAPCDDGNPCSHGDRCGYSGCVGRLDCACALAANLPLPATEDCDTPDDDNCDGKINESSVCGAPVYKFNATPECGLVCYYDETHNIAVNGQSQAANPAGFDVYAGGQLFDGKRGGDNWLLDTGAGPAQEWVAWSTPQPAITVQFPKPRHVTVLHLGVNNWQGGDVFQPPEIYLRSSVDGKVWSNALVFTVADATEPAIPAGKRGDVKLTFAEREAQFFAITFVSPGSWTFVDELDFD